MDLNSIKKIIEERGIHTVEAGFGDINGVLRGKRLPARHFLKIAEAGTGLAKAPLAWDIQCGVYDDLELANFKNGFPDMLAKPILSTFREIPWRKGSAFVLCDLVDEHGHEVEVAPRNVLRKVLKRAGDQGYRPLVGSELEFYLLDSEKKPLFEGIQCYSLYKGAELEFVIEEMRTGLEDFGIELEAFHVEYGPAQIEVIPEYGDALEMADKTMLIKNAVKEIARKHGLYASFMAKPWAGESGCGFHVHQSLWDRELQKNIFQEDEKIAQHYLAGLLHNAADFMVFGSPTINSYKRFTEHSFAPVNVTWGNDNRTVATRSLLGLGKGSRFEHRTGSADANPYLILAASIASGIYGIENKLTPPGVTDEDAYNKEAEILPNSLEKALNRLESSRAAKTLFGEKFIEHFIRLGRHEVELFNTAVTDWERSRYQEMA